MEIKITHFCLIIDFLDTDFNSNFISEQLKIEVNNFLNEKSIFIPSDWTINFQSTYNASHCLLISKNKLGNYKSDHTKEIKIVIPIPYKEEISWGCEKEKFIYSKEHYLKLTNNFWELECDYRTFSNRQEYILDCLRRGILKAFTEGFTVNGIKIRIKN